MKKPMQKTFKAAYYILYVSIIVSVIGCKEIAVPKPKGFFRIDMPEREYTTFDAIKNNENYLPFSFEYPAFGKLNFNEEFDNEKGWFNIEFPAYKASLYLTYRNINRDFDDLMEQTYRMNIKGHISRADAISESPFVNDSDKVFGILYDLKGNVATAVQFYMTDSVKHFLRGSLYFTSTPNADSLEPVVNYFREDIVTLIETLRWKN
jgi:gliding motility-associated lipoprotein GldD